MKRNCPNEFAPAPTRRAAWGWLLGGLLLGALLLAMRSGASWPLHANHGFGPTEVGQVAPHVGWEVWSPFPQHMTLRAKIAAADGQTSGIFELVVAGEVAAATEAATLPGGRCAFGFRLAPGRSELQVRYRDSQTGDIRPVTMEDVHLWRSPFHRGNALFLIAFAAVLLFARAGARMLGLDGFDLCCAAPLIGFIAIASIATFLSLAGLLTAGWWAASLALLGLGASLWQWRLPRKSPSTNGIAPSLLEISFLAALCLPSLAYQLTVPVHRWDDVMYHASRAGYWLANSSSLPFPAHGDRVNSFPMGGDLIFAWGAIISRAEDLGKFVVFLALPISMFAMLATLRSLGVGRAVAIAMVATFVAAPMTFSAAAQLKPDLWGAMFGLLATHCLIRMVGSKSDAHKLTYCALVTASVAAALGVKWSTVPLLILLPLAVWFGGVRRRAAWVGGLTFLVVLGIGGAGPTLFHNLKEHRHPFGSSQLRSSHARAHGFQALLVHFKRLPFVLVGIPTFPDEESRSAFEHKMRGIAGNWGAMETLQGEGEPWPGLFSPTYSMEDRRFSLAWMLAAVGGAIALGRWMRTRREQKISGPLFAGLGLLMLLAAVAGIRWVPVAAVPERFLVSALAFALIGAGIGLDFAGRKGRIVGVVLFAVLLVHAIPFLLYADLVLSRAARTGFLCPPFQPDTSPDSTLTAAAEAVPLGKGILLFAEQGSWDYPLFHGRDGFANTVRPWDRATGVPEAIARWIDSGVVDSVVFARAPTLYMNWDPPIDVSAYVRAMEGRSDFERVPGTEPVLVFIRKGAE